ncbi:MAG: transglycosylase domain-containing protein, partial [Egicoccus sp.]
MPEHPDASTSDASPETAHSQRPAWVRGGLIVVAVLVGLGLVAVAGVGIAFWRIRSAAEIPAADELVIPDPTVVMDKNGETIQTLEPAAVRANVSLDDLPEHVPQAIMGAEDRRFYEHSGFSARGIVRALWVNLSSGDRQQGASTITQQYVELAVEDVDDSYLGKFREVAVATKLESELDKDAILEHYLNTVPFGRTAYGIEAAAQTYFAVSAAELEVEQAAVLAGMIAAPTAFDPADNPDGAAERRDFALQGMVEIGALTQAEADEMIGTDLPELRTQPLFEFGPDAYFLDAIRAEVPELIGEGQELGSGLVVHTTLHRDAQQLAHEVINEHLDDTDYTGAIVSIEVDSGAVRVLLGGRDYESQQFNVALRGERQVGSAFKPFTLTELVAQGYDPDRTRIDAPQTLIIEQEGDEDAEIGNYTDRGYGEVDMRHATVDSINTAYVRMAEELGFDAVADRAESLGIDGDLPAYPSLTLGTVGVPPVQVAEAYATLAAEGVHREPYVIERIERHDGEVLYEHEHSSEEIIDANAAAVVTDVLRDVVTSGTGTAADIGRPAAGKTGTTNNYVDAWFAGYTPQFATVVWVGNADNTPMDDVTGGSLPAAAWAGFMGPLMESYEAIEFPEPDAAALEAWSPVDESNVPTEEPEETETEEPEPTETETEEPEETEPTESETPEPEPTETEPQEPEPTETEPQEPEPTETEPQEPEPTETEGNGGGGGDGSGSGDTSDGGTASTGDD